MTWKLWTALAAFGGCALLVLCAVIKGAMTRSPFDESLHDLHKRDAASRHDKMREIARKSLRRVHP